MGEITNVIFGYTPTDNPIEIDFDNPVNITAGVSFSIKDVGVGIEKWHLMWVMVRLPMKQLELTQIQILNLQALQHQKHLQSIHI